MSLFGLSAADFDDEAVEVWPVNMEAVRLFSLLSTQWRVGASGATGLDYAAAAALMDMERIKPRRRAKLLNCLRVMEAAVLTMWAEERNE